MVMISKRKQINVTTEAKSDALKRLDKGECDDKIPLDIGRTTLIKQKKMSLGA